MIAKKNIFLSALILVATLILASQSTFAQPSPVDLTQSVQWLDIAPPQSKVARTALQPLPSAYRLIQTDFALLQAQLATAPLTLTLPLPDGGFGRYHITSAPIMESELAAKYPELQTYTAQGIDDPTASARLDTTPQGFHAFIQSASGSIYIDPYQNSDTARYISYYKTDAPTPNQNYLEESVAQNKSFATRFSLPEPSAQSVGAIKRTYQFVMSSSGEFADFSCAQGGNCSNATAKRATAMAAIVTGMNRVTQLYERDLAISFVLVNNMDQLVFTDKNSDPYIDGTDANTMIDEMYLVVPTYISLGAYDIGHVIGAGGGGGLASTFKCQTNTHYDKSTGATALNQPIGDPFWVDYTAHEIGHQFNADHSYNASAGGGCTTRVGSSAYEPAGGTTIMSYAGICGGQDLQSQADAMFNAGSYAQIIAHVTNGNGATCDTETATGNTAPTVNAGSNYTVPKETPFRLTATRSDAEQATGALTTSWEQYDAGAAWSWGSVLPNSDQQDNKKRAILRVFLPASSAVRTVPTLANILDSSYKNDGEDLPSINQTLTFRATVRDNDADAGGVASDDMNLVVNASAGPFRVTSHASSQTLNVAGTTNVTWDVANTDLAPVSCATVDIALSADNGATFSTMLAANTPNDGAQTITIPATATATTQGRIQVKCSNNIFFDIGKGKLNIVNNVSILPAVSLGSSAYNVAETGSSISVVIKLDAAATAPASVNYATVDDTAVAGSDYIMKSGTVTFAAGEVSKTVSIAILDDGLNEGGEQFSIALSNPVSATLAAPSTASIAIADDDAPPPTLSMTATAYSISEVNTTAMIQVALSNIAASDVTVDYATVDGSATAGTDYVMSAGSLTFTIGQTTKMIPVTILNDTLQENDETFSVTLSNASNATLAAPLTATVTILENDTTYAIYLPIVMKD